MFLKNYAYMFITIHGNHSFPSSISKNLSSEILKQFIRWKGCLAGTIQQNQPGWWCLWWGFLVLNCGLFCAYFYSLSLWELMCLLNKDLICSGNILLTVWNSLQTSDVFLRVFFWVPVPAMHTGIDNRYGLLPFNNILYLIIFCLPLQKLSWMTSFSRTQFSWQLMTCARHFWGNILLSVVLAGITQWHLCLYTVRPNS